MKTLSDLSPDALFFMKENEIDEDKFLTMQTTGKFIDLGDGFIWIVVRSKGLCQLVGESTTKPWSLRNIKIVTQIWKKVPMNIFVKSEDIDVLYFFEKLGGVRIGDKVYREPLNV